MKRQTFKTKTFITISPCSFGGGVIESAWETGQLDSDVFKKMDTANRLVGVGRGKSQGIAPDPTGQFGAFRYAVQNMVYDKRVTVSIFIVREYEDE